MTVSPLSTPFIPVELELASLSFGISSVDGSSLVLSGIDTAAPSSLPVSTTRLIQYNKHTINFILHVLSNIHLVLTEMVG